MEIFFSENYDKYHCKNCYNGIKNFSHFARQTNVFLDLRNLIKFSQKINHNDGAFISALCALIKNFKYCKNDADQVQNDADPNIFNQPVIGAIKEVLRKQLTSIASKLLNSEHSKPIFRWRNKLCGGLLITATSTSSSLVNQTLFQNSNTTGLSLASSLYTFLLEWFSLPTKSFNFLQIQSNHQTRSLHLQGLLLHRSNHQFLNCNFQIKIHRRHRLITHYHFQICHLLPDQAIFNLKLTNTI
jgi:hypothetical protein